MNPILAASMPIPALMAIGALSGLGIIALSYTNWRLALRVAFLMVLFEGAIRKWVFVSGQELAYFLKDVFLMGAYLRFFLSPEPAMRAWIIRVPSGLIAALCFIVSLGALNPNIGSVILAIYGIKIYLFYIPMAFMIPFLWRSHEQMIRELTWYALLALPICLLGFAQFRAGIGSPLNVYAAQDAQITGFIGSDAPRITGTFSYLTGHTTFCVFFTALHIALLSTPLKKIYWWLLLLDIPLLLGNGFMGGSRASIMTMGLVLSGFAIASSFTKISKGTNVFVVVALISAMAAIGAVNFFPTAMDAWMGRLLGGEKVSERAYGMSIRYVGWAVADAGAGGYGIGTCSGAVERLRGVLRIPSPKYKAPVYDNEAAQVVVELGAIGALAWYFLRVLFIIISWQSFQMCPPGALRSLILATFLVQFPYLSMSIIFNHTANFLLFACFGFALIPRLENIYKRRRVVPLASQKPVAT